jgi:hypothetical protein
MVQCSRHDTPPAVILLAELSGHDLVLELEARGNGVLTDRWLGDQPAFSDETDPVPLGSVADTYESKYGPHLATPGGTWSGLGDSIRVGSVSVYRVAPSKAFGFGKGGPFSQTRWSFS